MYSFILKLSQLGSRDSQTPSWRHCSSALRTPNSWELEFHLTLHASHSEDAEKLQKTPPNVPRWYTGLVSVGNLVSDWMGRWRGEPWVAPSTCSCQRHTPGLFVSKEHSSRDSATRKAKVCRLNLWKNLDCESRNDYVCTKIKYELSLSKAPHHCSPRP